MDSSQWGTLLGNLTTQAGQYLNNSLTYESQLDELNAYAANQRAAAVTAAATGIVQGTTATSVSVGGTAISPMMIALVIGVVALIALRK